MLDTPIDFVIIWVDGSDPEWIEEKNKYQPGLHTDSSELRYRDWNNLEYWFRGVEEFAPWVNNIFFVTWGHLPKWLNANHPKLKIIKHEDYIPEQYLPTFSSHPIEVNLHRIKGLSEHFVYFNDDTFLIRKTKPEDFFITGLPKSKIGLIPNDSLDAVFSHITLNNTVILSKHFNKNEVLTKHFKKWFRPSYGKAFIKTLLMMPFSFFTGFYDDHLPNPFNKRTFNILWELEREILDKTSLNKFRSIEDVSQSLFKCWQCLTGEFVPSSKNLGKFINLQKENLWSQIKLAEKYITRQTGKMFCLGDCDMSEDDFAKASNCIIEAFEVILPNKSLFEK